MVRNNELCAKTPVDRPVTTLRRQAGGLELSPNCSNPLQANGGAECLRRSGSQGREMVGPARFELATSFACRQCSQVVTMFSMSKMWPTDGPQSGNPYRNCVTSTSARLGKSGIEIGANRAHSTIKMRQSQRRKERTPGSLRREKCRPPLRLCPLDQETKNPETPAQYLISSSEETDSRALLLQRPRCRMP